MRRCLPSFLLCLIVLIPLGALPQTPVTLSGTSYIENFNETNRLLPQGFSVKTGATASFLGNDPTPAYNPNTGNTVSWTTGTGQFANYASGNIGSSGNQSTATDRALGLRQTAGFGDAGAAFVFQVANTSGLTGFTLDFQLQSLASSSPRTVTWKVDYGFGSNPASFTPATVSGNTVTGGNSFSNNPIHVDFGGALDNQPGVITIRIVTLALSAGSGNRPTTAIDDFTLNWSNGSSGGATLAVNPTSLDFHSVTTGTTSSSAFYTLTGTSLTGQVVVTGSSTYLVSKDDITYATSLLVDANDPDLSGGKKIYVKFSPSAVGPSTGVISNSSDGATTRIVNVSGTGTEAYTFLNLGTSPYQQNFDTVASGLPSGVTVRTGASTGSVGIPASFNTAKTSWSNSGGGYNNYASGNIGSSESQTTATDRAIGVRQTAGFNNPGAALVFRIANTIGKINFTMDLNLQSLDVNSGQITTWRVDYGLGAEPTSFTVPAVTGILTTGGNTFSNNPVHVNFGNALDNQSGVITIRVVALNASTGSGNRATTAIDDLNLSWEDPSAKTLSISTTDLSFPATGVNGTSIRTYNIVAQTNLDHPISITATGPFTVSTDNVNFGPTASVDPADAVNKTVYVKFSPTAAGVFNGTVTNASDGAVSKIVTVSGEAIDPSNLSFNFNTCTVSSIPGSGFASINTFGADKWGCTQYGRNGSNGVSVNGYVGGARQDTAWLISPSLDLSHIVNIPVLSFYSRGEFTGPKLQLLISTDYDGSSNPNDAHWTEITDAGFPTPPGAAVSDWALSDNIDLSAYKGLSGLHIAFKYTSSSTANAARWTIDDVAISDQSTLLTVTPQQLSFGEVSSGLSSASQPISVKAVGSTDITVTPPTGYELSTDNTNFSASPLVVDQATAAGGTTLYVRFSPTAKQLKVEGYINVSAAGLNKNTVFLTGSSYPKSETFDVACYNLSFFGSNSSNNPTPQKITAQINNIATVMQHLNADVIGIEEVSSDDAINSLLTQLPGYAAVLSPRWSYSYDPPDPSFPPQKVGFIYNTATMTISATEPPRVLFEAMYDSVRLYGSTRLVGYPEDPTHFWSSGRLPFMVTFDATVNGTTKKIRLIDIHAKAKGDVASYNRRVYDAQVLKDTLDAMYRNDNVILLGDYNDRLYHSIYTGTTHSPYENFVNDKDNYAALTYPMDSAGKLSFLTGTGMIDHIIISHALTADSITLATNTDDARAYIPLYNDSTASDHLPVFTRFNLAGTGSPLPIRLMEFDAQKKGGSVLVTWTTAFEQNNDLFIVERSGDGRLFSQIATVNGKGNSNSPLSYSIMDAHPLAATSYYRLRQVDRDGKTTLSPVVAVRFDVASGGVIRLFPNPVTDFMSISGLVPGKTYNAVITGMDGKPLFIVKGTSGTLNFEMNRQLAKMPPGVYAIGIYNGTVHQTIRFIRQ